MAAQMRPSVLTLSENKPAPKLADQTTQCSKKRPRDEYDFSSEDAVLANLRSVLGLSVGKSRLTDDLDDSKHRHNKSSARSRHKKELANRLHELQEHGLL